MRKPTSPGAARIPGTDDQVGPYRLLTKIGEGGMGVVHLAQARDGARVALKVLRPHIIGDDEARERLAREVSSLRRVSSPRIAEVIDADPWGETPYVATRYVPGLSLHQHIGEEGPLSGADLRWFAACLAEAVIAVHSVGVLHRDIKPSNVLLEGRSPVLIDFGLARLAEDPRMTHAGWLLGTPGYLAPEVLYGEDATTASDVHAWAATVVFAATGRPPFGTGPAMAIMDRVRRGEHDLRDVPGDLFPVVAESLASDPEDRPSTGAVLAAARATVANGAPVRARAVPAEATAPYVLAARERGVDPDRTDRVGSAAVSAAVTPPATTPVTLPGPGPVPPRVVGAPHTLVGPPPGVLAPTPSPQRPESSGTARFQRATLLAGLFGCAAAGFAAAPYVAVVLAALVALVLRTQSWTMESAWSRRDVRGRRRWYDGPVALLTAPWYLLVATGGTLLLMLWSASVTLLVGIGWVALALPPRSGLWLLGGVFALTLWQGPGAARLRRPTRRLAGHAVRVPWLGWVAVGLVLAVLGMLVWQVSTYGPSWQPQPGPPWREQTMLGDFLRRL